MDWENYKTAKLDKTKLKFIKKYLFKNNIKNILEIGCATGIYSNYLSNHNFNITSIDINNDLLKKAKSKYKSKNIKFLKKDIEKFKLKNKADAAIIFDVLEHVDDTKAIKNIAKSTKKIIIGSVPRTTDKSLSKNYLLFKHHLDNTHKRTYKKSDLKKLFRKIEYKKLIIKKTHPISTEGLLIDILEGNIVLKKLIRKITILFLKPKNFYSNLMFVVYLK